MHTVRSVFLLIVVASMTVLAPATPRPVARGKEAEPMVPLSFTLSPTSFVADGQKHHPTIIVSPSDATYVVSGVFEANEPGTYTFTVEGTGKFTGTATCTWQIKVYPARPTQGAQSPSKR